jgi:hypothetical protein
MVQNILVYIILFLATAYVVFSVVRSLRKKDKSPCDGCKGCDLKAQMNKQKEKYRYHRPDCYNS